MQTARTPIWQNHAPRFQYPPLASDMAVDVTIVGAGMTGLTAAYRLASAGIRVAVVDAGTVGGGETSRTTAHITAAIDARYHRIERAFGADHAKLVAASSMEAIRQIEEWAQTFDVNCHFERLSGYLFSEQPKNDLDEEAAAARRAGLEVERIGEVPLPFPTYGGIRFPHQAQMDPLRYVYGLASAIRQAGGYIFEGTRVVAADDSEPCRIYFASGHAIRSSSMFFATHVPLNRLLLQTKLAHFQSYVLAFDGGPKTPGLFWDSNHPYHYARRAVIRGHDYLLVGGGDHKTGIDVDTEAMIRAVRLYAASHFGVDREAFSWSGQVIEPIDGLPYIGRNSLSKHVYVATGFNGNGMTFGTVAGMVVSDLIMGRQNSFAETFAATRIKPLAGAEGFVAGAIEYPIHLVSDWLVGAQVTSVDQIARGEGKTLKIGGERLAVYRGDDDVLHAVSPVCTHLGCGVRFNSSEKTWDCPCHGSRFGIDGSVICGPALIPLKKKGFALTRPKVEREQWTLR